MGCAFIFSVRGNGTRRFSAAGGIIRCLQRWSQGRSLALRHSLIAFSEKLSQQTLSLEKYSAASRPIWVGFRLSPSHSMILREA